MSKLIFTDGASVKGINPWDLDSRPEAWTNLSGGKELKEDSLRLVSTIYAALDARYKAASDVPFTIYGKGDKIIDDSDDWQNAIGFMPDPSFIVGLAELSLATTGTAYFFSAKNKYQITKELKYWLSSTVTPKFSDAGELLGYVRKEGGKEKPYKVEDVMSIWLPDDNVEVGPPLLYPLAAALVSGGALQYINLFVRDYMQRGAVKAMILALDGNPPEVEQKRIENWFNTFMRGARTTMWKAFNMQAVKPTIIGEGLEALANLEIKSELKQDVLEALGVPASLLAANWASREGNARKEDERHFYTKTIMPDLRLFQFAINKLLEPMNYRWQFDPARLEAFQTDESEKITSLSSLLSALEKNVPPEKLKVAIEISGLIVTDEQMAALMKEEEVKEVEEAPEAIAEDEAPEDSELTKELGQWRRHALRVGGQKSAETFDAKNTPADMAATIRAALKDCQTKDDVKAVFAKAEPVIQTPAVDYSPLIKSIELGVDALSKMQQPIVVNNHMPAVNIPASQITVTQPEMKYDAPSITVNVPEQVAPQVTVNMPEQVITVNVPEQAAPSVTVNNEVHPAPVTVAKPPDAKIKKTKDGYTIEAK